jgi:branched-chain amino acid transport system permease protein
MISLGVAELVASSSLILRSFFGGEAGISANRTKLLRVFDWNFGPHAVRDNPESVQFVGYDPRSMRAKIPIRRRLACISMLPVR